MNEQAEELKAMAIEMAQHIQWNAEDFFDFLRRYGKKVSVQELLQSQQPNPPTGSDDNIP